MSYIFNIQRYSLHDGDGIRTTVFMKGCPLHCRWCCNPESQNSDKELMYFPGKCIGEKECGFCRKYGAEFADEKAVIDLSVCPLEAAGVCPSRALKLAGKEYSADEILDIAERDGIFFGDGGGITISGGEPLTHPALLFEILKKAKMRHIGTAMETCGYADYAVLYEAAKYLDMIMFDIKSLNNDKHIEFTGRSNKRIIENFSALCKDHPLLPKKIRTPVIPGFNDTKEDIEHIVQFLKGRANISYELLPYHSYGRGKYAALGREYAMGDAVLGKEKFLELKKIAEGIN